MSFPAQELYRPCIGLEEYTSRMISLGAVGPEKALPGKAAKNRERKKFCARLDLYFPIPLSIEFEEVDLKAS